MNAIRATVRNGRIEPEVPIDFPDGTELLVYPSVADPDPDDDWDDTPEGIVAWLQEYDALQPLIFTDEERAALEKARAEQKAWELAHFEERAERLRKMWE